MVLSIDTIGFVKYVQSLFYQYSAQLNQFLFQIPFYSELCEKVNAGENCKTLVGYSAVYKMCFGMASFFLFFAVFTIRVNNSTGCRAAVHNG